MGIPRMMTKVFRVTTGPHVQRATGPDEGKEETQEQLLQENEIDNT